MRLARYLDRGAVKIGIVRGEMVYPTASLDVASWIAADGA